MLSIRRSKTDQYAEGQVVAVAHGQHAATDPIAALDSWLVVRGSDPGGLFTALPHRVVTLEPISGEAILIVLRDAPRLQACPPSGSPLTPFVLYTPPAPSRRGCWTGSPPKPHTNAYRPTSSGTSGPLRHWSTPLAETSACNTRHRLLALRAMVAAGMGQRQFAESRGITQPTVRQQFKFASETLEAAAIPILQALADEHDYTRLAFFGLVVRHQARQDPDTDLLVEATEGTSTVSFIRFKQLIEQVLGREIDLGSYGGLSRSWMTTTSARGSDLMDPKAAEELLRINGRLERIDEILALGQDAPPRRRPLPISPRLPDDEARRRSQPALEGSKSVDGVSRHPFRASDWVDPRVGSQGE